MTTPPVIPPDTRAPGYSGHINDHNAISDSLSWLMSAVTGLVSSQQTASYTLAVADLGTVVEVNSGAPATVTVPPSSSVTFPVGAIIWVCSTGTGVVTIAAGAGVTLRSLASKVAIAGQYAEVKLRQRAQDTWVLTGSLA